MKNIKTLIKQFNSPDVQIVVSGWPERHDSKKGYHGDAAFTRETLLNLVKNQGMRFVVIAEVNHNNSPELLADGKILVLRVIDHGKFHLYPIIVTWLHKFPAIRHVTVHSNFTYSGMRHFILLIPFLALIKLTGHTVTLFSHNVLNSINFIAQQMNIKKGAILNFMNFGLKLYNRLLGYVVDQLVVLDISGKKVLENYISEKKLLYIPHWVKQRELPYTQNEAKKMLGISLAKKVILSFGFISYYKGSDILAQAFSNTEKNNENFHLIFVGGQSPSLSHTSHYQKFYSQFVHNVKKYSNITLTGFLPADQVALYFAAADLVVLPYRGLMGGSGALAWTSGFHKPFMISQNMNVLWENPDLQMILKKINVQSSSLMFQLNEAGIKKIFQTISNKPLLKKMEEASILFAQARDIDTVAQQIYNSLYAPAAAKNVLYEKDILTANN